MLQPQPGEVPSREASSVPIYDSNHCFLATPSNRGASGNKNFHFQLRIHLAGRSGQKEFHAAD